MTIRSERLLETSLATSIGLVSQLVPFLSDPSGIVMMISSRGFAGKSKGSVHTITLKYSDSPLTASSYSALSFSNILIRWSKNSGGGCSYKTGRLNQEHEWAAYIRTSSGYADADAFLFFFSFGFFVTSWATPAWGPCSAGSCAGCDADATGVAIVRIAVG